MPFVNESFGPETKVKTSSKTVPLPIFKIRLLIFVIEWFCSAACLTSYCKLTMSGAWEPRESSWSKVEQKSSESHSQLCPTPCDTMNYTVHGILQARILEGVAYPFSSRSSWPRNWTGVSCIAGGFFTNWAIRGAWTSAKQFPQGGVRLGWENEEIHDFFFYTKEMFTSLQSRSTFTLQDLIYKPEPWIFFKGLQKHFDSSASRKITFFLCYTGLQTSFHFPFK